MQPYQEEYISNIKDLVNLITLKKPGNRSFEEYEAVLLHSGQLVEQKIRRNTELLRKGLRPMLDHMPEASPEALQELQEFAETLFNNRDILDTGLFCQIHQALLNLARLKKDRNGMIRELYWLGMGRNDLCTKVVGLDLAIIENYISGMRLCFTEAAAYLKYFDEIDDLETKGYILRSRANISLGRFKTPSEKIHMVKRTLQILQDKEYQEKAPELPWDRYIYLTHQQMAACISHSRENPMTAEDIAVAMESVYIVYQRRLQEAASQGKQLPLRPAFSHYTIEFHCGLDTIDGLLAKLEHLMDMADPSDFSADNMYGLISLPAFYLQYLANYPDRIPERKEYIAELYQRILHYMDAFPESDENETLFLYLRQLAFTFLEVENSIPYSEFLQKLMMRFTPNIYVHSYIVGKTASALCEQIISEEPTFFDDIEYIKSMEYPDKKRQAIMDYAMGCGFYHDVGKINFINLYSHIARQWLAEEYEMAQLHTIAGHACLAKRPSTQPYATAALGHHSWYDGTNGYPKTYKRLECPDRQLVDIISLVSWLEDVSNPTWLCTGIQKAFDEAVEEAISLEGKRFSPLLTARLHDREFTDLIRHSFEEGHREADYKLYTSFDKAAQK